MHRAIREAIHNINIDARIALTQCDLIAFNETCARINKMVDIDISMEDTK